VKVFLDTNILIYAQHSGPKADRAQALIAEGGVISVQVLNETASVLSRKFGRQWAEIEQVLCDIDDALGEARPLTIQTHKAAVRLASDHNLSFYDALIIASALEAECDILFSEDLQDGRRFEALTVRNPFGVQNDIGA
jgi:predicted nucleic acid-binding protein